MNKRFIALLVTCLLLGSCSSDKLSPTDVITQGFSDLRTMAASVVTDSLRREKYLRNTQALEDELRAFEAYAAGVDREYRIAFSDYGADAARLRKIGSAFREEQKKARDRFIDAHLGMAASVTAEEWKALAKEESRIIEDLQAAAARSLQ